MRNSLLAGRVVIFGSRFSHRLFPVIEGLLSWGKLTLVTHVAGEVKRVVHITEASGGGVLQVISQISRHQEAEGVSVEVAFTDRLDTPRPAELAAMFPQSRLIRLGSGTTRRNLLKIFRFVREALQQGAYDVIHLHSSYAGVAGRVAKLTVRRASTTIVYSPHAYAFLRCDLPRPLRQAIRFAEATLAGVGHGTIAVSHSEGVLARELVPGARTKVLNNCLELSDLPSPSPDTAHVVANIGRLVSQKGPERFLIAADTFAASAKFVWIGGPTSENGYPELGTAIEVTGNIPRSEAIKRLSRASVHLFTSKWEGMPLALMESQAMGIPAIAWDCPGTRDVVIDGETGYIVTSEFEMLSKLRSLLADDAMRLRFAANATRNRHRFSSEGYGRRSLEIYRQLSGPAIPAGSNMLSRDSGDIGE